MPSTVLVAADLASRTVLELLEICRAVGPQFSWTRWALDQTAAGTLALLRWKEEFAQAHHETINFTDAAPAPKCNGLLADLLCNGFEIVFPFGDLVI